MEQYWYILKNNKHLGPYYLKDLIRLKEENKIDHNVELWHPKWPAPSLSLLCAIPPLPIVSKKVYKSTPNLKTLHRLKDHENKFVKITSHNNYAENFKFALNFIEKTFCSSRLKMLVSIALFNAFLFYIIDSSNIPTRPQQMSPTQYNDLQTFWNNNTTEDSQQFTIVTSKDFKTLWIAQKKEYEITTVNLFAKSANLLSNFDFNKKWQLDSNNLLQDLQFETQQIPVAGFYNLEIEWKKPNPWSLSEEEYTTTIKLKIGHQDNTLLNNQIAQFHSNPEVAASAIKNSNSKSNNNLKTKKIEKQKIQNVTAIENEINATSTSELKEKYQTLSFIISDVKNSWTEMKILNFPKLVKAMNSFQHRYAKSTGGFLTALVLSNEKEIKLLSTGKKVVNTDLIAHLTNLNDKAKLTGILSADLMSNYQTFAKNPKKENIWEAKLTNLEKDLTEKMNNL